MELQLAKLTLEFWSRGEMTETFPVQIIVQWRWGNEKKQIVLQMFVLQIPFMLGDGKSLKSFEEWNFLGQTFLTIALLLKDIQLGLKSPMGSFPSIILQSEAGW